MTRDMRTLVQDERAGRALGKGRSMGMRTAGVLCGLVSVMLLATHSSAEADPARRDALLFSISKSENKNRVVYEVKLDESCRPAGTTPVHAYWRMLERSSSAVEPLLPKEERAYGFGGRQVVARDASGGTVRFALRALPDREVVVRSGQGEGGCFAQALTRVGDAQARLFNVHARLAWPFGISSIVITGWAEDDGHVVRETVHP